VCDYSLIARQYLDVTKKIEGHDLDLYFPPFTTLELAWCYRFLFEFSKSIVFLNNHWVVHHQLLPGRTAIGLFFT
jgi:hypothetical protein